jgi:tetratricopeptide (TPR) repeat protein
VAEDSDHHRLLAEAHEGCAKGANPEDAKAHFRSAAESCTAVAAQEATSTGKTDWLCKAAGLFAKGGDRAKALAMLADLTTRLAEYPEDRVGRAWVETGEVYLTAGDKEQARLAFRTAAGRQGPDRDRARVRFAALSAETDPAQAAAAIAMLEDVVNAPAGDTRDKSTQEEAAYRLGELHLVAKQFPEAEVRLRMALDVYPESPRAARGRYQLGQALRQKAAAEARKIEADRAALAQIKQERLQLRQAAYKIDEQSKIEDRIDRSWKAYEEAMRAAYETFRKTEEQLLTVKDADPEVMRRTSFWAADCAHWLGEYGDCAGRYEKLIGRYKDTVWELDATRNLHRCCRFAAEAAREAKDADGAARWTRRAFETFAKVKEGLARVPATELDGSTELKTKAFWDKWVAENGPRAGIAE